MYAILKCLNAIALVVHSFPFCKRTLLAEDHLSSENATSVSLTLPSPAIYLFLVFPLYHLCFFSYHSVNPDNLYIASFPAPLIASELAVSKCP
ncbi:hypothetical protein L596_015940 [Steinernema carpocapsae]|uniref:Uncharacterized protein n=1 Tax=Steinernema carpocapsae TaxID=34508 RepID=A0A4U5NGI4_STECR|nr:hypothetical protein L596_015940 [Steinernema carpocapsae]